MIHTFCAESYVCVCARTCERACGWGGGGGGGVEVHGGVA
jgi:hypothetical protein